MSKLGSSSVRPHRTALIRVCGRFAESSLRLILDTLHPVQVHRSEEAKSFHEFQQIPAPLTKTGLEKPVPNGDSGPKSSDPRVGIPGPGSGRNLLRLNLPSSLPAQIISPMA